MSVYWHFECEDHDPPIQSEEFTQHTDDRHYDHGVDLALTRPLARDDWPDIKDPSRAYFDRNARSFLRDHPKCTLALVSELAERRELTYPERPVGAESEQERP